MKIPQVKRATALEIAILFYGRKFLRLPTNSKAYDKRRETLVLRYANGLLIKDVAKTFNRTPERGRQLIAYGLRLLRHPNILPTWKMLVAERPGLATSQLAEDTFGYSIIHEKLLEIANSEEAISRHFQIL